MNKELINFIHSHLVQIIVFDLDGTLIESNGVKTQAFADLYAEYGEDIVAQVIDYHLTHEGISRVEKIQYFHERLLKRKLSEQEVKALGEKFSALTYNKVLATPMVDGAEDFINNCLANRIKLYVASATPQEELTKIITARKLNNCFDGIYGSPISKAEAIKIIIKNNAVSPKNVLMIGDAMADYCAAEKNQVAFCLRINEHNAALFKDKECIKIIDFN